jgi:uncharacterized YigZ family protein
MIKSFKTVLKDCGPVEIKEKGSKFISYIYHVESEKDVEEKIKELKKKYYDSTHICYAFIIGKGNSETYRFNDDGEPSKTAGYPIYLEIKRMGLTDVAVFSVRYFGGTKLGTGGLVRAYCASSKAVLDTAQITEIKIKKIIRAEVSFELVGMVMQQIDSYKDCNLISQTYNENGAEIKLKIPVDSADSFINEMREKSSGRVEFNDFS